MGKKTVVSKMLKILIAFAAIASTSAVVQGDGPPPFDQKAETARWMTKNLNWGTVSTISTTFNGVPFGNPNSFVAVKGRIFFYVSTLDATMKDVAKDPRVSLTVTEAQIPGRCGPKYCALYRHVDAQYTPHACTHTRARARDSISATTRTRRSPFVRASSSPVLWRRCLRPRFLPRRKPCSRCTQG